MLHLDTIWFLKSGNPRVHPLLLEDPLISELCPLEESASHHKGVYRRRFIFETSSALWSMVAFGVHNSDTSTQGILMHGYVGEWRRRQLDSKKTQDDKHKSTRNPPEIIWHPCSWHWHRKKYLLIMMRHRTIITPIILETSALKHNWTRWTWTFRNIRNPPKSVKTPELIRNQYSWKWSEHSRRLVKASGVTRDGI